MPKKKQNSRALPSHAVLRSFECAARHESFTLAAEELHLTQSAISRQVRDLEIVIGTPLFRRVGRRIILTRAGANLASNLQTDLENLRNTVMRAISSGEFGVTLRIAVLPGFASRWLVPKLPKFSEIHPNVEVYLSTRLKSFDIEREPFDLAIHFGKDDWPNTKMVKLCSETLVAVCSPAFKNEHRINSASDLARVPLIHMHSRAGVWEEFFERECLQGEPVRSGKYFDQFSMIIAGAVASIGAALIPQYLIESELSDGSLQILSTQTVTTQNNYYLVMPAGELSDEVQAFSRWMKGQFSKSKIL